MAYEYSLHSVKQPNFKEALVVFKLKYIEN